MENKIGKASVLVLLFITNSSNSFLVTFWIPDSCVIAVDTLNSSGLCILFIFFSAVVKSISSSWRYGIFVIAAGSNHLYSFQVKLTSSRPLTVFSIQYNNVLTCEQVSPRPAILVQ